MAKIRRSLMKISGTLYDATFVNSKRYGRYVRAPRGTYKKAEVNAAFSTNANNADIVTQTGKVIHDYIKSICDAYFKKSDLWQQLMKRLFKAPSMALNDLLESITELEVNSDYPLDRLITPLLHITASKKRLQIQLLFQHHPLFPNKIEADSYYYSVHLLYLNKKGEAIDTDGIETEWVQLNEPMPQYELSFDVPTKAKYYVLVLEVAAGLREVTLDVLPGKGMRIIKVGAI